MSMMRASFDPNSLSFPRRMRRWRFVHASAAPDVQMLQRDALA